MHEIDRSASVSASVSASANTSAFAMSIYIIIAAKMEFFKFTEKMYFFVGNGYI